MGVDLNEAPSRRPKVRYRIGRVGEAADRSRDTLEKVAPNKQTGLKRALWKRSQDKILYLNLPGTITLSEPCCEGS